MPRPERQLDPANGTIAEFAARLRRLRHHAGSPGYRRLARIAHYSSTTLSDAANGRRMPSLDVTLAYVRACDGDPVEWETRWRTTVARLSASGLRVPPAVRPQEGVPVRPTVGVYDTTSSYAVTRARATAGVRRPGRAEQVRDVTICWTVRVGADTRPNPAAPPLTAGALTARMTDRQIDVLTDGLSTFLATLRDFAPWWHRSRA
jgi:hypothetical protein